MVNGREPEPAKYPKNNGLTVIADLTNTSDVDTTEVLQVYMRSDDTNEVKNTRLVAFARVSLKGKESGSVKIPVVPESFKVVNEEGEKVIPEGKVSLFVGFGQPDARTAALTGKEPIILTV